MGYPAMKRKAPEPAAWNVMPATEKDWPGIWTLFQEVVKTGDTYSYAPDTKEDLAKLIWMHEAKDYEHTDAFVVKDGDKVVGSCSLRRNHYGLGAHVANAAYMTDMAYRGKGIATAMCMHSLREAKKQGCLSMQFNYVVSTNTPAVNLWQSLGFKIIGISPKSYKHAQLGYVDIFIMHRFLDDIEV